MKQKLSPSTVGYREWKVLGARGVQGQLVRHLHRWDQGADWSWLSTYLDSAFPGRGGADADHDDVLCQKLQTLLLTMRVIGMNWEADRENY